MVNKCETIAAAPPIPYNHNITSSIREKLHDLQNLQVGTLLTLRTVYVGCGVGEATVNAIHSVWV